MCFDALFCVYCDYLNSKQKAKQYTENLPAKLHEINILPFPGPGAALLGWPKSIY